MRRGPLLLMFLLSYVLFAYGVVHRRAVPIAVDPRLEGRVVVPAAVQRILYGGDAFLAANVESSRVMATGAEEGASAAYLARLHESIAALNPCHEDNYYVANGLLSWGGHVDSANKVLQAATTCRSWDEVPPFFLGYNQYFFRRDRSAARKTLELAAQRSPDNRAGILKLAIMIEAERYPDARRARAYLGAQRDGSLDSKLKQMLDKRMRRLDGLILLQDAAHAFEIRFGRVVRAPQELIDRGLLAAFPVDPMGIGYTFEAGQFALRELSVDMSK